MAVNEIGLATTSIRSSDPANFRNMSQHCGWTTSILSTSSFVETVGFVSTDGFRGVLGLRRSSFCRGKSPDRNCSDQRSTFQSFTVFFSRVWFTFRAASLSKLYSYKEITRKSVEFKSSSNSKQIKGTTFAKLWKYEYKPNYAKNKSITRTGRQTFTLKKKSDISCTPNTWTRTDVKYLII